MRFILVNFSNFWQINDRQEVWSGQEKGSLKNAVNNGATMASKRLKQSVLVAIIYVNDGILCRTEVTIIHSWLSRSLTARGSCIGLVTVGPTKV